MSTFVEREAVVAAIAKQFPNSWLDPLLSGKKAVPLSNCSGPQIEALVRAIKTRVLDAIAQLPDAQAWRSMESAPKGAKGYSWMFLAWGPDDDKTIGEGMRFGDQYFAAPTFYSMNADRKFQMREVEVFPTHWQPFPPSPLATHPKEKK